MHYWAVMMRWLGIVVGTLGSAVRTHRELALENLALRQQLAVWKARQPRPRLTEIDRIFWVLLSKLWTSWRHSLLVVQPQTVIGWQRRGFRRYWAWKSRRRSGRPVIDTELRDLIRRMSRANPLWGAPRIHGELLKLGLAVSQATVSKYMLRSRRPPSQAWQTFLKNHRRSHGVGFLHGADGDVSGAIRARPADPQPAPVGAFQCDRAPDRGMDGAPTARGVRTEEAPRYLIRDRDRVDGERFSCQARNIGNPGSGNCASVAVAKRLRSGSLVRFDGNASTISL